MHNKLSTVLILATLIIASSSIATIRAEKYLDNPVLLYDETILVDIDGNKWLGPHMYGSYDYRDAAVTYIDTNDGALRQVVIEPLVGTDTQFVYLWFINDNQVFTVLGNGTIFLYDTGTRTMRYREYIMHGPIYGVTGYRGRVAVYTKNSTIILQGATGTVLRILRYDFHLETRLRLNYLIQLVQYRGNYYLILHNIETGLTRSGVYPRTWLDIYRFIDITPDNNIVYVYIRKLGKVLLFDGGSLRNYKNITMTSNIADMQADPVTNRVFISYYSGWTGVYEFNAGGSYSIKWLRTAPTPNIPIPPSGGIAAFQYPTSTYFMDTNSLGPYQWLMKNWGRNFWVYARNGYQYLIGTASPGITGYAIYDGVNRTFKDWRSFTNIYVKYAYLQGSKLFTVTDTYAHLQLFVYDIETGRVLQNSLIEMGGILRSLHYAAETSYYYVVQYQNNYGKFRAAFIDKETGSIVSQLDLPINAYSVLVGLDDRYIYFALRGNTLYRLDTLDMTVENLYGIIDNIPEQYRGTITLLMNPSTNTILVETYDRINNRVHIGLMDRDSGNYTHCYTTIEQPVNYQWLTNGRIMITYNDEVQLLDPSTNTSITWSIDPGVPVVQSAYDEESGTLSILSGYKIKTWKIYQLKQLKLEPIETVTKTITVNYTTMETVTSTERITNTHTVTSNSTITVGGSGLYGYIPDHIVALIIILLAAIAAAELYLLQRRK